MWYSTAIVIFQFRIYKLCFTLIHSYIHLLNGIHAFIIHFGIVYVVLGCCAGGDGASGGGGVVPSLKTVKIRGKAPTRLTFYECNT